MYTIKHSFTKETSGKIKVPFLICTYNMLLVASKHITKTTYLNFPRNYNSIFLLQFHALFLCDFLLP